MRASGALRSKSDSKDETGQGGQEKEQPWGEKKWVSDLQGREKPVLLGMQTGFVSLPVLGHPGSTK